MIDKPENYPCYADFLLKIFNYIFPLLAKKGVEFYKWYWTTYKPEEQLYSSSDLREMAGLLDPLRKDNNIDELAEWLQHQPISDAVGVMDAIQMRIAMAEKKPLLLPGHPAGCVEAVLCCLLELASRIDEQKQKKT